MGTCVAIVLQLNWGVVVIVLHIGVAIYNERICKCIDNVVIERYVAIVLQLYSEVVVIENTKKPKFVIVGNIVAIVIAIATQIWIANVLQF